MSRVNWSGHHTLRSRGCLCYIVDALLTVTLLEHSQIRRAIDTALVLRIKCEHEKLMISTEDY